LISPCDVGFDDSYAGILIAKKIEPAGLENTLPSVFYGEGPVAKMQASIDRSKEKKRYRVLRTTAVIEFVMPTL
jgi:hypothetical protein